MHDDYLLSVRDMVPVLEFSVTVMLVYSMETDEEQLIWGKFRLPILSKQG